VAHNSAGVIENCLSSLRAKLPNAEIIVVNNASSDITTVRAREVPGIKLLANASNIGFGRACNQGACAATGSHVLFANPDVELLEANAESLRCELFKEPFGLVAPLFRNAGSAAPLLFRDSFWPLDVLGHAFGPLRPHELPRLPTIPVGRNAWWPSGAMILCRRAEFLRVGGFRPEFFLYYEDRDLARRYRAAGLPMGTTRSIVARHTAGTSSATDDSLRIAASAWAYLGWIEYLCCWHGDATARRAAAAVDTLRIYVYRMLACLESRERLSERAARKRRQLLGIEAFVCRQSDPSDAATGAEFCPHAKRIIAELRALG
jgi:N-acetylglucosaminyl-diphospho-decaprenol L-rhamnosyltransferase